MKFALRVSSEGHRSAQNMCHWEDVSHPHKGVCCPPCSTYTTKEKKDLQKISKLIIYQDFARAYRWRLRSGERGTIASSERGHREKSGCAHELEEMVLEYPEILVRDATVRSSQRQPLSEWLASQTT